LELPKSPGSPVPELVPIQSLAVMLEQYDAPVSDPRILFADDSLRGRFIERATSLARAARAWTGQAQRRLVARVKEASRRRSRVREARARAQVRPTSARPLGRTAPRGATAKAREQPRQAAQRVPDRTRDRVVGGMIVAGSLVAAAAAWLVVNPPSAFPAGTVTVTSRPAGAQILINGQPQGISPLTLRVPAGDHALELRSSGPTQVMGLHVERDASISRFFDLPVGTAAASLRVSSTPAGARVLVDGHVRGRAPLLVAGLSPGPHTVRAEQGALLLERSVMLESGATMAVALPLGQLGVRATEGHGWIALSVPVEIQCYEGDRLIGSTRAAPWQLPAGRHDLDFVNETLGIRVRKTVEVVAARTVSVDLPVPTGHLSMVVSPSGDIQIDGEPARAAPLTRPLAAGTHDVVVRHPSLGERRFAVTVIAGGALRLNVDLRK
jgi:hypothetical protein